MSRFNHGVRLDDDVWVRRLIRDIAAHNIGLLVLETARSLFDGDENSSADVSKLFRNLKRIRDEGQVTIVLSHHTPREGKGYRGSGVFEADVDMSLSVQGSDGGAVVNVKKARWGKKDKQPIFVRFADGEDGSFHLRVVSGSAHDMVTTTKHQAAATFITALLRETGEAMRHKDIITEAKNEGHTKTTAKAALKSLVETGVVLKQDNGLYRLVEDAAS